MDKSDSPDKRLVRHELGFLQAASRPTAEDLKAYYADKYYQTERGQYRKSYDKQEIDYFHIKIAQKADLAKGLLLRERGRFLDVGCGEGFALAWFKRNGWEVEGIDFSNEGISRMNPDLLDRLETGNVFHLLQERIVREQTFDLVWLGNVLEHVVDPVALLKSLRSLTGENGCLVVTVPNDGSLYQEYLMRCGDIAERFWIALPDHLSYFTQETLRSVAEATGWACREILTDFPIDWYLLHPGSNYVKDRRMGPDAHKARIKMELFIGERPHSEANAFYASLARIGLGRDLTAFLTPKKPAP